MLPAHCVGSLPYALVNGIEVLKKKQKVAVIFLISRQTTRKFFHIIKDRLTSPFQKTVTLFLKKC